MRTLPALALFLLAAAAPGVGLANDAARLARELIATYDKASYDCRSGHFDDGDPCELVEDTMRNLVAIGYCSRKGEWVKGKAIEPTKYGFGDCQ